MTLAQRLRQLSAAAIELWQETDDPTAVRLILDAAQRLSQAALIVNARKKKEEA